MLAPEGVPQATVHYDAFLAPFFPWIGVALLAARLWRSALRRGRSALGVGLAAIAGRLAEVVRATLARQQRRVTRGTLLAGPAFAFGVSTAVFNATYAAQSHVDAELTNGADVSVTGTTEAPPSRLLPQLRALPGVIGAAALQHRYAFVGNDLQDLYGIDPRTIAAATPMSNAFFGNNDAAATLRTLANTADWVLVSDETVQTYQLHLNDTLLLRSQNARTHRYVPVRFRFVGVSREFPTAPKDSFIVANAAYVAQQTGSAAAEIVLLRPRPEAIASVAAAARGIAAALPGASVTDIVQAQRKIGASRTAVDLHALTALELGFAVAQVLVVVLTGVFDPPPAALTVPWLYLLGLVAAALASAALAVGLILRATGFAVVGALRGL